MQCLTFQRPGPACLFISWICCLSRRERSGAAPRCDSSAADRPRPRECDTRRALRRVRRTLRLREGGGGRSLSGEEAGCPRCPGSHVGRRVAHAPPHVPDAQRLDPESQSEPVCGSGARYTHCTPTSPHGTSCHPVGPGLRLI